MKTPAPEDALKLENQLCFLLYAASKELVKQYKPMLDALDLTYTQYIAMLVLWEHEAVSVKDLGGYLQLDSGTLTPLLKRLEHKGYVKRSRSAADERMLTLSITAAGAALKEKALSIPGRIAQCLPISQEDALSLYGLLKKINGAMQCAEQ